MQKPRGQSDKPSDHHGSSPVELAAINKTLIAFAEEHHKNNKKNPSRETWKFRLEIAAAVGIAAYTLLTAGLLIAGAVQTGHSGQQVKTSQDQLGVMQDQEHRQLRAYVGISPKGIENFGHSDQVLHTMRKNHGATPANDLFMDQPNIRVVPIKNLQFAPAVCWPAPPRPVNTLTLFPSQELRFDFRAQTLTTKETELVGDGTEYQLLYWGTLHYKDVFGEMHCTRYCWAFKGAKMTENDSDYCLQHNDAY